MNRFKQPARTECTQAANAIRLAAIGFVMHPAEWTLSMTALADIVERYDGNGKCPLCGGNADQRPHSPICPIGAP